MRSLYSNSDTPFDLLPYTVRERLVEREVFESLRGGHLGAAEWMVVAYLRRYTAAKLADMVAKLP